MPRHLQCRTRDILTKVGQELQAPPFFSSFTSSPVGKCLPSC